MAHQKSLQGVAPEGDSVPAVASTTVPAIHLGIGSKGSILGGLEDCLPSDLNLTPPRLRIIHKKERREDPGEPGQLQLGSQFYDSLEVVFVKAHTGRQCAEGEGRDTRTTCASTNGKFPHPTVAEPKDSQCGRCEYGKWKTNPAGGRIAPKCQLTMCLLGVVPELDYRPFWFIGSKTGRRPTLEFVSYAQAAQLEGLSHVGQLVVRMTTAPQTSQTGQMTWYVPVLTVILREEPKKYQELFEQARDIYYLPPLAATVEEGEEGEQVVSAGDEVNPFAGDAGADDNGDLPF